MYSIWLYFVVECSLKSFSWKVEVNPSKARKPTRSAKPYMLSPWSECAALMLPVIRNSVTPPVIASAISQSFIPYIFPDMMMPQIITGIILKLFPSICTGKDTHFNASYWQVVAATLLIEIAKYFHSGHLGAASSEFAFIMPPAKAIAKRRLTRTRNTLALKRSPSYGTDMTFSWMKPYRPNMTTMPRPKPAQRRV